MIPWHSACSWGRILRVLLVSSPLLAIYIPWLVYHDPLIKQLRAVLSIQTFLTTVVIYLVSGLPGNTTQQDRVLFLCQRVTSSVDRPSHLARVRDLGILDIGQCCDIDCILWMRRNIEVTLHIKRKHLPRTVLYTSACFAGAKAQDLANLDKTFTITSAIGSSAVPSSFHLDLPSGTYCDQIVMCPGTAFYIFFFQLEGKILWPIYLPICTRNHRHKNERAIHDFQGTDTRSVM